MLTACGGGGGPAGNTAIQAPSSLTYGNNPAVYTKGASIPDNAPSSSGGKVASYSVSPALPTGLSLDPTTGVISGTPAVLAPISSYTVTAANAGGDARTSLSITVNDRAPAGLVYNYNSIITTVGAAIPSDQPANSGGLALSYSVSPAFPTGISMDSGTGVITGTPTVITGPVLYVVTASNSGGATDAYLDFSVVPPGPVITSSPASVSVPAGQTATFSITVTGSGPFTYQWRQDGSNIYGATSASYTTPPVTLGDTNTSFDVVVLDAYGSQATSPAATLTVTPATTHFTFTGSLSDGRENHSATLLSDGRVLIAGGTNGMGPLNSAEIYDPATGAFTPTGSMNTARTYHTATLLPDGRVLVTGGVDATEWGTSSCEVYDPALGTWNFSGSLNLGRYLHTATLLANGKVLIAGGLGSSGPVMGAELYDPATGQFTPTGTMNFSCEFFTATLLQNGQVLIVEASSGGDITEAELYDPVSGAFTATGSPITPRSSYTTTLLTNGKVLLAGGVNSASVLSCEVFDPSTGTFSTTGSLNFGRSMHTATLLPGGKVLIAGGGSANGILASAELFDPATGAFTPTSSLNDARELQTATALLSGKVLIVGGTGSSSFLSSAELYQ